MQQKVTHMRSCWTKEFLFYLKCLCSMYYAQVPQTDKKNKFMNPQRRKSAHSPLH